MEQEAAKTGSGYYRDKQGAYERQKRHKASIGWHESLRIEISPSPDPEPLSRIEVFRHEIYEMWR
jgi:hypothetical protein